MPTIIDALVVELGLGHVEVRRGPETTSEVGFLSKSLGVSAKELATWENAGKTVGASVGEIASSFAHIRKERWPSIVVPVLAAQQRADPEKQGDERDHEVIGHLLNGGG
jgi:hypothetical protein